MHIPDGFLSIPVALFFWAVSLIIFSYSLKESRKLDRKRIPLIAAVTAFVFAAQMLNFPVLGGTSGHLIGGALLALLFGFSPAVVMMSLVLVVQALVFHDGGTVALGANIFNMAIVAPFVGAASRRVLKNDLSSAFAGSVLSVIAAATFCSIQLALSGVVNLIDVLFAMLFVHLLIGIGEAVISTAAIAYQKDVLPVPQLLKSRFLFISIVLALFLSPFASSFPDGLEKTAENLEFDELATSSMTPLSVMADYLFPGIENEAIATALAGVCGTLIVFAASFGILYTIKK